MAPGAKCKFRALIFEPEILRKQVYCNEESICDIVGTQTDKLALLAIILLLADVSPTYSSGLPQSNVGIFRLPQK